MRLLKGLAANLCFIAGAVLLLPIGIMSDLLERASRGLDVLGYAISDRLPTPRVVFSDAAAHRIWLLWNVAGFVWSAGWVAANLYAGQPAWMLLWLALAMLWAASITHAWEQRHAN